MTATTRHILHAYAFDGHGGAHALSGNSVSEMVKGETFAWVHMDAADPATREWITQEVSYLDPLVIEALLAEETRPRFAQFEQGAIIILRGVNLNPGAAPEDMISIRMWVDKHRIISLRLRSLKPVQDMESQFAAGKGVKNAGDFIVQLAARLTENMEPVLGDLHEIIDNLEAEVLDSGDASKRDEIVNLRKKSIILKRYTVPQRDVISQLRVADFKVLSVTNKRQLQESYDRITRHVEDLDAVRERSQIIQDELTNELTERLNKNLFILSIISAIFIPLTFVTGLFGMNVGGIPGAENGSAFPVFVVLMVAFLFIQLVIFRRLKWF